MSDAISRMIAALTPLRAAMLVLTLAFATIAGAWVFEWAGYLPCELCLKQRWAYYAGVPLAAIVCVFTYSRVNSLAAFGFALLALIFVASSIFGAYHAGVEWGFWLGPQDCTGSLSRAGSMDDFLNQLQTVKVVRCDAVAIRILGLSLAGWNAVISAGISLVALHGARAIMTKS